VHTLVATPLWASGHEEPPLPFAEMDEKVRRLAEDAGGALGVRPGFLFEFGAGLPRLLDRYGERLALGGRRHLLIALPKTSVPAGAAEVWGALARRGFSVVVASPECSPAIRRSPAVLGDWSRSGVKFQVDAAAVAGSYGREVQRFALDCLRRYEGCAAVASNANGPKGCALSEARVKLTDRLGARRAHKFISGTPSAILDEAEPPAGPKPAGRTIAGLLRSLQPIRTILG